MHKCRAAIVIHFKTVCNLIPVLDFYVDVSLPVKHTECVRSVNQECCFFTSSHVEAQLYSRTAFHLDSSSSLLCADTYGEKCIIFSLVPLQSLMCSLNPYSWLCLSLVCLLIYTTVWHRTGYMIYPPQILFPLSIL